MFGLLLTLVLTQASAPVRLDNPATVTSLGAVPTSRSLSTGTSASTGLSGGGDLSADRSLSCVAASGSSAGCWTTGTQALAGDKTISGNLAATNLTGTNTGDMTLGAVGSTPSANGASLSGQVLTLQPEDSTHPGVLSNVAQTISGVKTFSSVPVIPAGAGAGTVKPQGVLSVQTGSVGTLASGETDLFTYSLPAGSLGSTGQAVRVTAWGTFAVTGNNKRPGIYFGSTLVTRNFNSAASGHNWRVSAVIIRTGAGTQDATSQYEITDGTTRSGNFAQPTETLSGAVTIKVTGLATTADNDIVGKGMMVEFLN